MAIDTNAEQAFSLGQRLGEAVRAAQDARGGKTKTDSLRLFGGYSGVADFRSASIEATELMRRATAALDRARAEPEGSWLRDYEVEN